MFKKSSILCLSFFLFTAYFCAKKGEQWKGSVKKEQGVTIVKNPKEPLYDENIFELEEELVIPESDGKNYIFVNPASLVVDKNNNIYVLDSREANIKVFNEHGKFLRTIGSKGHGPGELDVPGPMDMNQNEIAVRDAGNRRITFYSLDGEYKRSLSMARSYLGDMKIDSKGNIFGIMNKISNGKRRFELQKFDSELNYMKTFDYIDVPVEKDLALFMAGPCFAILKGDLIAYGFPEKDYDIKIYNNDGTLIKRILREYVPDRIPQEEIESVTKNPRSFYIPKYYSPYYKIHGDDKGRILTYFRHIRIKNVRYFDIFSPAGKYLTKISLKIDFNPMRCVWKNDRLYTMGNDKGGLPVVRIFHVKYRTNIYSQQEVRKK